MRGRPPKSDIRKKIAEILYFIERGYGYDIYKAYIDLFPKVSIRSIYYHLKQGVKLNEFKVDKVEVTKGDYSWGGEAEKTYYALGEVSKPSINLHVKEYFEKRKPD